MWQLVLPFVWLVGTILTAWCHHPNCHSQGLQ